MSTASEIRGSICDLLRSAALGQLDLVVSLLSTEGPISPESVHRIRRAVKRVRAMLQLIHQDLGSRFSDYDHRLQAVNRRLSSTRDLDVCLATAAELDASQSPAISLALERLKTEFILQRTETAETEVGKELQASLVEEIQAVARGISTWTSQLPDFEVIRPAVREMAKRARRKLRRLNDRSPSEDFHTLRKIVKLRLYWLEFLLPLWPRGFGSEHKLVNNLSDYLGKHHDFVVLELRLQKSHVGNDLAARNEVESLSRQIQNRQRRLAAQSLKLGRQLFAEHAKALTQRWEAIARIWQTSREPEHSFGEFENHGITAGNDSVSTNAGP